MAEVIYYKLFAAATVTQSSRSHISLTAPAETHTHTHTHTHKNLQIPFGPAYRIMRVRGVDQQDCGGGVVVEVKNRNKSAPFRFKPSAPREPDGVNEGKGVGYLTEKLEVGSLSPGVL